MFEPFLSILIINWNSKFYLRNCIKSIYSCCVDIDPQIVVVDSGSFDGCKAMIEAEFPDVDFVQSRENIGFANANNLGFKYVKGKYLLLLNPDTELKGSAIQIMMDILKTINNVGIVAPKIINPDGSIQTSCVRALPTPLNQAIDCDFLRKIFPKSKFWGTWDAFTVKKPVEVSAVSGACMLLKSEVFQKVGGFSSEYFMYAEDMDLCFKVRRIGLKIYHVPNAVIVHYGGGSSKKQISAFSIIRMRESNYIYMLKNHGLYHAQLYRFLQGFSALVRLGIMVPFLIFSKDSKRMSLRYSVQKWVAILKWALKDELKV